LSDHKGARLMLKSPPAAKAMIDLSLEHTPCIPG
jgi:hypothetical protein